MRRQANGGVSFDAGLGRRDAEIAFDSPLARRPVLAERTFVAKACTAGRPPKRAAAVAMGAAVAAVVAASDNAVRPAVRSCPKPVGRRGIAALGRP